MQSLYIQTNFDKFLQIENDSNDYFLQSFIYYSPLITYFFYFLTDLILITEKFLLEKPIKNEKPSIQIKNLKTIKYLNHVSHIFLDKNSLIEPQNSKITGFLLADKYIEFNENDRNKMQKYFSNKKDSSTSFYFYFCIYL